MIYPFSGPGAGTRILATVKWYDPAKGYGFLVPGDGSPDIYCREAALAAVGLDTLLAGATVACETTQGQRGPEVSRVHAVDFSTASPRTASFARTPGNEPIAAGASGRRVRALIKWFMPTKGYGFLEPEDGSADLFCHMTAVQASGRDTLPEGCGGVGQAKAAFRLALPDQAAVGRDEPAPEIGCHLLESDGWKIGREQGMFVHAGRGSFVPWRESR